VRSDQEQKDIIVAAAMDIFLEVGFVAMRMEDVASACTISKRTLYRLFPSKLDLFRSLVVARGKNTLDFARVTEATCLEDALVKLLHVDVDSGADLSQMRFVQLAFGEARVVPDLEVIVNEEGFESDKKQLASWLAGWKKRGAPQLGDTYAAASLLIDLLYATSRLAPNGEMPSPAANRNEYLRECIRYFVHGVT
jgi:AcrR family transcriptional regulator